MKSEIHAGWNVISAKRKRKILKKNHNAYIRYDHTTVNGKARYCWEPKTRKYGNQ